MKTRLTLIVHIFLLLICFFPINQLHSKTIEIAQLMEIKEKIYHFEFDSAQQIIHFRLKQYPRDLSLNFYDAFVDFMGFSQDVTKTHLEKKLIYKLEFVNTLADSILDENPDDIQALYHKALAMGLKGVYHVVRHEYVNAYWYGGDGIDLLEEVVEKDPGYTDAYFGLGLFHYYIDLMPGLVKFFAAILGYSGSREQGLREITMVADSGTVFKVEAKFALGTMFYFVENDIERGISWYKNLEKDYPGNPLVNLMFGIYFRRLNNIDEAKRYTRTVLKPYKYRQFGSLLHGAYYNYARCFFVENKMDSALAIFNEMDRAPTAKSMYFRSTMNFWRGYLNDLMADHRKAKIYYNRVYDSEVTQRWYDYVKHYMVYPLTPIEIEAIKVANMMQLNGNRPAAVFIDKYAPSLQQLTSREKGRFYLIKGLYYAKSGQYAESRNSYLKSADFFSEAGFEPMVANANFELLKLALEQEDLETAEKAYDDASEYEERYFQIRLRKWWSDLDKKLDQE